MEARKEVLEEELSSLVQKYECLYDKNHSDFLRRDVRLNAWTEIAAQLDMKDGEEAEKAFNKLRDRYARARKLLNDSDGSVTNILRAEGRLANLRHLEWLGKHIIPRSRRNKSGTPKSLLNQDSPQNVDNADNLEEQIAIKRKSDSDDIRNTNLFRAVAASLTSTHAQEENDTDIKRERKSASQTPPQREPPVKQKRIESESTPVFTLATTSSHAQETMMDEYDLFGQYVATKMRKLSQVIDEDKMESVEYEITTILMKARMKKTNES